MPGDEIRLSFSREPALNGTYPIDETGLTSLPLIGAAIVTDRPATQVRSDLEREYARLTRNQTIMVVPLRRIRVLGEVRNPGIYHVDPTMSFDDAIALAGGGASDANLENVSLMRDGERIASGVDVRWSVGGTLHSGDQIFVPRNSWFYRNAGVLIGATISAAGVIVAFSR